MKKFIFLAAVLCLSANSVLFAQKLSSAKVPEVVKKALQSKSPNAENGKWEMEGGNYEVNYKAKGESISMQFSPTGKWLETETKLTGTIPALVTLTINKDYKGFKMGAPEKIETSDRGTLYEVVLKKDKESWEVLFNADGKVLKKDKE